MSVDLLKQIYQRSFKQSLASKLAQPVSTHSAIYYAKSFAQIAQLVEQRTENPRVTGSIPVLGTFKSIKLLLVLYSFLRLNMVLYYFNLIFTYAK